MTDPLEASISKAIRETHNLAIEHAARAATIYGAEQRVIDAIIFLKLDTPNEHNSPPSLEGVKAP
jgi:hypothetical protein